MMEFDFNQQVGFANTIAAVAMNSGQRIGQQEAADRIQRLESDCMTLVLRLMGEHESTFAPETLEVMSRWRTRAEALLKGKA